MSANTNKCADQEKSVCDYNEFRRLRYFHGMLLDDKDFQAEQQYHAGKRRLLNRMLHGSGVVCGLDLKGKKDGRWIEIASGLALDCSGNEIWVPEAQRIDLASLLPPKDKAKSSAECKEEPEVDGVKTYYIGIRYDEKPTNPVSVYLPSGSCEERTCENSRYKEGFCVEIVDCCPEKYPPGLIKTLCDCENGIEPTDSGQLCRDCGALKPSNANAAGGQTADGLESWCKCVQLENFCEQSVDCPQCCSCDNPCFVILGQIKVKECKLQSVCNNECRSYVLTGRLVQHLLLGVFAGSEEYFYALKGTEEVSVPDVGEFVNNPIKGLCWVLRYLLVEGGEFKQRDCKQQTKAAPQDSEVKFRALEAQVQTLTSEHADLAVRVNESLARLTSTENVPAVAAPAGTETQPSPKPPKK